MGLPDPASIVGDPENSTDRQSVAQDRLYFGNGISVFGNTGNHHIIIRNCKVHSVGGNGIAFSKSTVVLVEGNTVYDSTHRSDAGNSAISLIDMNDNLATPTNYGVVIRNNVCYNNRNMLDFKYASQITDGNGVILDLLDDSNNGAGYNHRTLIANNLFYNNGGRGAHAYYSSNVDIVNNTSWHNLQSPDLQTFEGELSSVGPNQSVNFYNNISVAMTGVRSYNLSERVSGDFSYNLVNSDRTDMQTIDGTNLQNMDPLLANPSPTSNSIYDFQPQAGSPVIDAAMSFTDVDNTIDGFARPVGAAYDMGIFDADSGADPTNNAPLVNAGADAILMVTETLTLNGTVSDDGLPSGTLTTTWTKVNGAGAVTGYAAWAEANILTGDKLETADPDNDGLTNLLEYALNLDPETANTPTITLSSDGLPTISQEAGELILIYRKDTTKTDITYTVTQTSDLATGTWDTTGISDTSSSSDGNIEIREARITLSSDTTILLRLEITQI